MGLSLPAASKKTTTTTAGATTTTVAESTSTTAAESTTTVSAEAEMGREIKIGNVVPMTGVLANFGAAEKLVDGSCAARLLGDGIVLGDGKKHKITFIAQDTQSDSNRASQVAGDMVMNEKVDFLVASGTPDTVLPAGNQAEVLECPFVSCFNDPWEACDLRPRTCTLDNE